MFGETSNTVEVASGDDFPIYTSSKSNVDETADITLYF